MYCKGVISNVRQLYYKLRSIKGYYFIPLVFLYVLLPIINTSTVKALGVNEVSISIICTDIQRYIPFMGAWWALFAFKEFVEGEGREVLRVYKRNIILDVFLLYAWYLVHAGLLFIVYSYWLTNLSLDFLRVAAQSFLFLCGAFFFMFMLKSIAITFLLVLAYGLFNFIHLDGTISFITLIRYGRAIDAGTIFIEGVPILIICIVFLIFGNMLYKSTVY